MKSTARSIPPSGTSLPGFGGVGRGTWNAVRTLTRLALPIIATLMAFTACGKHQPPPSLRPVSPKSAQEATLRVESAQAALDQIRGLLRNLTIPKALLAKRDAQPTPDDLRHLASCWRAVAEHLHLRLSPESTYDRPKIYLGPDQTLIVDKALLAPNREWCITKEGLTFDPNAVLSILNRLSIEEGFTLDYIYHASDRTPRPTLYARRKDAPPLPSSDLLIFLMEPKRFAGDCYRNEMDAIKPDGTPESFVQLAIFCLLADQVYLPWPMGYYEPLPLCDKAGLERFLNDPANFLLGELNEGYRLPKDVEAGARQLDVIPTVTVAPDRVSVDMVYFNNWRGFLHWRCSVSRAYPHRIIGYEETESVPYDCGFLFWGY